MNLKALKPTQTEFVGLERIEISPDIEEVAFVIDDMTSVCPITGQPDFESVVIRVTPNGYTIETKSLKLYLETFRNQGIFAEHLATKIARDVQESAGAKLVIVELTQHTRGGIVTKVTSVAKGVTE